MRRLTLLASLAAALAGCVDPAADDAAPTDTATADDAIPPEGGTGWTWIDGPMGRARVPYVVRDGLAMWEDDIALGPVAEVARARHGGAAHKDLGRRWPGGVVRYRYDASVQAYAKAEIRTVLDTLEARTPLTFTNIGSDQSGAYVEFRAEAYHDSNPAPAWSDEVGRSGGEQGITFNGQPANPDWDATIMHEVLHAVGMFHEQSRPDRDDYVMVDNDCINWSALIWENQQLQYEIKGDALGLGPYDFASIMHYSTGAYCKTSDLPAKCTVSYDLNGDGVDEDYCATMVRRVPGGSPATPIIRRTSRLSVEDTNTLWRMYDAALGTNLANDHLGVAVAIGDFDGDGYDDLATGTPDEDGPGIVDGGVVHVFKGTSSRLVPWRTLSLANAGGTIGAGDHFGAALAAGDLDGDGKDDLVVGAPGKDLMVAGVMRADAGEVAVFRGSTTGLTTGEVWTQDTLGAGGGAPDSGDRFGAAVAMGTITGPGPTQVVAIGAPGDRNPILLGTGTTPSGAVFLTLDPAGQLLPPVPTRLAVAGTIAGDDFGASLAIGRIDTDGTADLVVGAPGRGNGAGAAYVYVGNVPQGPPSTWPSNAMATFMQRLLQPGGVAGNRFGAALAVGDLLTVTGGEVVVGAPGTTSGQGAAVVFTLGPTHALRDGSAMLVGQTLTQALAPASAAENGDGFGAAIAYAVGVSGRQVLAIGAPGEDGDQGAVTVLFGGASITGVKTFKQASFAGGAGQGGDRFGASLAFGQLDASGEGVSTDVVKKGTYRYLDLIAGAPGDAPEVGQVGGVYLYDPLGAGSVYAFAGTPSGGFTPTATYHQERAGQE